MHAIKRTILVTGASSGIGRAIARQLLFDGHCVIGTSRDPLRFSQPHAEFIGMTLDLAQLTSLEAFGKALPKQFPQLDTVIFAAGYGQFGGLEQFSYSQIERLMTVNFTAQACLTRTLLPHLKQKQTANLIYIGSEAALKGSRNGSIYCASKFALRGFVQALRDECGKTGLRVSIINPGMVDTAFFENLNFAPGTQPGQALSADDIANTVRYILQAGAYCGVDEINLSPNNKVIEFKKPPS
jgi:NADP-dependent 3-hydroxy acid dehydrogenase YdfG